MAYLSGYSKYKVLTLTGGASGALTDHQLKLAVAYEAAMQGDFDDLRFTQADGTTLVDAWAEVIVTDTSATAWVEFPTTPANTVEQIYRMYYGNAGATSYWDGSATFLQWHGSATTSFLDSLVIPYQNIAYESKMKVTASSHNIYMGVSNNADMNLGDNLRLHAYLTDRYVAARNDGTQSYLTEAPGFPINTYVKTLFTIDTATLYGYVDSNEIGSGGVSSNLPNTDMGLCVYIDYGTYVQDWSFARKYVANPPTYAFGAEQSVPTTGNPYWYYNMLKRRNS